MRAGAVCSWGGGGPGGAQRRAARGRALGGRAGARAPAHRHRPLLLGPQRHPDQVAAQREGVPEPRRGAGRRARQVRGSGTAGVDLPQPARAHQRRDGAGPAAVPGGAALLPVGAGLSAVDGRGPVPPHAYFAPAPSVEAEAVE